MAVAKKAVKKPSAPAQSNRVRIELPSGYEVIAGSGGGLPWDMKKLRILEGTVVLVKDIPKVGKMKKDTQLMEVKTDDGKVYTIWRSASIAALFEQADEGDEVAFAYNGEKKIPGQRNPMHDITGGIRKATTRRAVKKTARR